MPTSLIEPPIEQLLAQVTSKFELVTLAGRRARNINSYFNQLGDGLGHMIPPQVSSTARKPLSIAFEEIAAGKILRTAIAEVFEELGLPTNEWPSEAPLRSLPKITALKDVLAELERAIDNDMTPARSRRRGVLLAEALREAGERELTRDEMLAVIDELKSA